MEIKYKLNKINNKYLIFNVIGYAGYLEEIISLLVNSNTKLRKMSIQNYTNGLVQYITKLTVREIRLPSESLMLFNRDIINSKYLNFILSSSTSGVLEMMSRFQIS